MSQTHPDAEDFNFNWRFYLADAPKSNALKADISEADALNVDVSEADVSEADVSEADVPKVATKTFDDSHWRQLRLPHDWSIEASYSSDLEGATAYLPGGVGWYRKHFKLDKAEDEQIFLYFDGVYNHVTVWLNGHKLWYQPYGYTPFYVNMSHYLEADNVLAVQVDHSRYVDSRWYTGSGIYRDVTLVRKAAVFVPIWGVTVRTPQVSQDSAQVALELDLHNSLTTPVDIELTGHISDAAGQIRAEYTSIVQLDAASKVQHVEQIKITQPSLWSPDIPHMYTAVTQVILNDEIVDTTTTPFGLRYFHFDADRGFFLNGQNTHVKGVCLHHDAGLVGAAVPDGVWRRRLEHLKTMGCNAIRTAHNPPSARFLDLCDELGFLVQNEFFDEWSYGKDKRLNKHDRHGDTISQGYADYFQEWAEHDLKTTILRDKNHPCIFQWGIGNEIEWTYLNYSAATGYFDVEANGNYFWTLPPYSSQEIKQRFDNLPAVAHDLAETAQQLAEWTRELDDSRPVIANCILPSASHITGYGDALDIVGYSYRAVMYDRGHADFPNKVIMGTENLGQWHEWKNVIGRPFISGLFFWTGIDYLGEAEAHSSWPVKATASGMLDLASFPKPAYHMIKSLWQEAPHCQVYTQLLDESEYVLEVDNVIEKHKDAWRTRLWFWHKVNEHWNYPPDEMTVVEAYSNCDTVELFLNGISLGEQRLQDQEDRIFKWAVPFIAGKLEARATNAQGQTVTNQLITAGPPHHLKLTADKLTLHADAYDVSHITVQLCDAAGNPVRHEDHKVNFELTGPYENLGVDNGAADNVQAHNANCLVTSQGHALMIIRSTFESGSVTIQARADGLAPASLTLEVQ